MSANRQPKSQSRLSLVHRSPASDAIAAPNLTKIGAVFVIALLIWLASGQILPKPVHAAGVVGTGTPASCTDAAFNAALAGGGLITFNCGPNPVTIDISPAAGGTGTKTITVDTTIDGGGLITISGGNTVRVFNVNANLTFTVQNLTIADGNSNDNGGGIYGIDSSINIFNSIITNNKASFNGGGFFVDNVTLNIKGSTISNNFASNNGGGAYTSNNFATNITSSNFIDNKALGKSGGLYNINFGCCATVILKVDNSKFANNNPSALNNETLGAPIITKINSTIFYKNFGYGIVNSAPTNNISLVITNSTISGNNSNGITGAGSIIISNSTIAGNNGALGTNINSPYLDGLKVKLSNSIITDSTHFNIPVTNCSLTVIDDGNNLQWPDNSCSTTIPVKDPKLAPLAYNGGPTLTHALLPGSPAIDAGNSAVCAASPVNNLDQRGFTRVTVAGGVDVGKSCDIGAYESPVFVGGQPSPTPVGFDGTQPDASPILNNYPGLNFQPCFSFRDWTLPSTLPFRFVAGTNPKGYIVNGNRSAIIASNTGKFKCQVSLVSGTPPSATGSKPKPGTELEADAWSFEGSSPTAIKVEGVDAAGNVVQSQTIPANLNTGTTTKVTLDKPGVVAIIFNVDIPTASAPCDLNNNEFYRFCIAVDNFSVTPITPTVVGSVTLLPGSTRVAFADDNGGTKLEAVTPSANNTLGLGAVSIQAGGTGNIPVNARGVVGVLTAIGCTKGGNMRFWTGNNVPDAVNLNISGAFNPVPNLSTSFVAPLDSSGKVNLGLNAVPGTKCGYAVDVVGYFNYTNFLPATARIAFANGTTGTKLVATGATPANPPSTSSIVIEVAGKNGIPSGAKGIMGVLTAIGCTGGGNLRLWAGSNVPSTVNLNIAGAFKPVPNLSTSFTAPLDANGKMNLGLGAAAGVSCGYAVDVVAYITDAVLLPQGVRIAFVPENSTQKLKSDGATPTNPPAANSVAIKIGGVSGIPANAKGVIGVLTAIGCTGSGNLRFWAGTNVPNTVNLNIPGAFNPVPNLSTSFVAPLDSSGNVNLGLARLGSEISCGYAVDITGYIP